MGNSRKTYVENCAEGLVVKFNSNGKEICLIKRENFATDDQMYDIANKLSQVINGVRDPSVLCA
jgi:hypothetical protein